MSRILIGTSSWSKPHWVGPFYPRGTKDIAKLARYAETFPTVEVDATYYRVPPRSMVAGWRERAPDGFVFAAKVPDTIVGGGRNAVSSAAELFTNDVARTHAEQFFDAMRLLGPRAGPLLLQFSWFKPHVVRDLREFLGKLEPFLASLPREFRYAVEVRNKEWMTHELADALRRHRVALALVDFEHMPRPDELDFDVVTTDFAYVRLMGDKRGMKAEHEVLDRILLDQEPLFARWLPILERLRTRVDTTFVYVSDTFAGFGPASARELMRRLGIDPPEERASGELFPS